MQHCDSKCQWCARQWWKWLKSREHQMNMPWEGAEKSFAEAALTSNRAPRPGEPCHCSFPEKSKVSVKEWKQTFEVVYNQGHVGLDGRHWVKVRAVEPGLGGEHWTFHAQCGNLRACAPTPCEADF